MPKVMKADMIYVIIETTKFISIVTLFMLCEIKVPINEF
jgi:hypothetical protein